MKKYYYQVAENVLLVDGKSKSCIYDLNANKLYHINHALSNFIKRYLKNPEMPLNDSESKIIQQLKDNGIDLQNQIVNEIVLDNKITFAWIEVCNTCNLKCVHCYNESDYSCSKRMSYDNYLLVIDNLLKLGIRNIQFIGGEPLILGDELKRMIQYAFGKFDSIEVFTNGTLIDESWIECFMKYNVKIALSVYSYIKEEHDKVTQYDGSFERTNKSIEQLKYNNLKYRVCNTIMDQVNIGEKSTDLYTLSSKKDIVRMSGRGNLHLLNDELIEKKLITKRSFCNPINTHLVKKMLTEHNCFGSKLYISSDMTVYPCVMERRIAHGTIIDGQEFKLDESILSFNKDRINGCKDCEFRYCCFDCRPDSLTDNVFEKPWYCTYYPEKGSWETVDEALKRIKDRK